jgi:hypothetical protein
MKETIVTSERELAVSLRNYLSRIELPRFRLTGNTHNSPQFDDDLEVQFDNRTHRFVVEYKLNPSVRDVETMANRPLPEDCLPILVGVRLTDSLVSHCKRQKINCLDLNGRIWIRTKGLLIDKNEPRREERVVLADSPVDFFSQKSSRLARVLLTYRNRSWKQSELAAQTELSQGLLSRLLRYASNQGWVDGEGTRASWRIIEPDGLLDAWEKADKWEKRAVVRQYSTLESDFDRLARSLLEQPVGELAFTQWFAANLRFPYTEPPVLSAYLRSLPDDQILSKLRLREVGNGGKLWIIIPSDPGVFRTQRNIQGLPIVADVQIYLDLVHAGLRGPDQARELRKWEGFCK